MERNCVPGHSATIASLDDTATLRVAALSYAARGWPVFPVYGVHPIAPGAPELLCGCPQGIAGCSRPESTR